MRVRFEGGDVAMARHMATYRTSIVRVIELAETKSSPASTWDLDLNGAMGEVAFCKSHNVFPDFTFRRQKGGADCHYFGSRIAVKATFSREPYLWSPPWGNELPPIDYYVLVHLRGDYADLLGWATPDELFGKTGMHYGKEVFMLQPDELHLLPNEPLPRKTDDH